MPAQKYKHVSVLSREDNKAELDEMFAFLKEADAQGLLDLIDNVLYDSVNSICQIEPKPAHRRILSVPRHPVMAAAMNHISQFEWAGEMQHSPQKEKEEFDASNSKKESKDD